MFAAVHNPQRALSAILTATARTRTWLDEHGDDLGLGPLGRVDVVGEMPARVRSDGYEVNATFPWDRRALAADDVDVAVRRLGWQHDDLLALAADVDRFEDAHGPLPTDDATGERTADAVLRHVAGAAAWYVEQLDGARSGLAADAGDAVTALTGARAWSRERLLALGAADDGREVTDEHGETWTLAKVVRRSLYHAFDHLWELERRLARADGTADRIEVTLERRPDARDDGRPAALRGLGRTAGRPDRPRTRDRRAPRSSRRRGTATGWWAPPVPSRTPPSTPTSRPSSSIRTTRAWASASA